MSSGEAVAQIRLREANGGRCWLLQSRLLAGEFEMHSKDLCKSSPTGERAKFWTDRDKNLRRDQFLQRIDTNTIAVGQYCGVSNKSGLDTLTNNL